MKINNYQAVVLPHRNFKGSLPWELFGSHKCNPFQGQFCKNNPLWEAIKFLLILLLILLIATPQLVLAVLLMLLIGAVMETIRWAVRRE